MGIIVANSVTETHHEDQGETTIQADIETVWSAWNNPDDIVKWNAASDDWHTVSAEVDLREGGQQKSRMEAKDGSMGFDFVGTYVQIIPHELIDYVLEDGREVKVLFSAIDGQVKVVETFDAEQENSQEMQRAWVGKRFWIILALMLKLRKRVRVG